MENKRLSSRLLSSKFGILFLISCMICMMTCMTFSVQQINAQTQTQILKTQIIQTQVRPTNNILALQEYSKLLTRLPQTRLNPTQERKLCKLQLGTNNWKSQYCDMLSDEQSQSFEQCYNECLESESQMRFCQPKGFGANTNPNTMVTADIANTCSNICFDSLS